MLFDNDTDWELVSVNLIIFLMFQMDVRGAVGDLFSMQLTALLPQKIYVASSSSFADGKSIGIALES